MPHRDRKLHLLLPIDSGAAKAHRPSFCKTLLSLLVHGYDPIIINWDADHSHGVGFLQRLKITGVHDYLTNITNDGANDDIVFMMDALDIWLQLSPRTLVERFEDLGTSGVVVGAETSCWPNPQDSFACQGVPNSTLLKGAYGLHEAPRWANSGTVLGSVTAMRTLYNDLIHISKEPGRQDESDQAVFNEFLAARRISVDYHSRIVWTTGYDPGAAHFINTPDYIDAVIPHELYPPVLHLEYTGGIPVAIHFNGPGKPLMGDWWGRLWWQGGRERLTNIVASRVERAVVRLAGGGEIEWGDICPNDVFGT